MVRSEFFFPEELLLFFVVDGIFFFVLGAFVVEPFVVPCVVLATVGAVVPGSVVVRILLGSAVVDIPCVVPLLHAANNIEQQRTPQAIERSRFFIIFLLFIFPQSKLFGALSKNEFANILWGRISAKLFAIGYSKKESINFSVTYALFA